MDTGAGFSNISTPRGRHTESSARPRPKAMEQLDQLHVVSDLHLGGEPGHQIFDRGALLAATIDHLRERPAHLRVGLVLDGDIVDFLADPEARYLDPEGAVRKLEAIIAD